MDLYEIVTKLTGPIGSVGETNADNDRHAALDTTIELVDKLISDLETAARTAHYPEASRAKIGKRAGYFLAGLRDSL